MRPTPAVDRRGAGRLFVGLSFVDLLYAIPLADLATRVSTEPNLNHISPVAWAHLTVCLVLIIFSWIGLHQNREAAQDNSQSSGSKPNFWWSKRFMQFMLEIAIVAAYFVMGLHIGIGSTALPDERSMRWVSGLVFAVFALYFGWDALDIWSSSGRWRHAATKGGAVTGVFCVAFGLVFALIWVTTPHTTAVIICVDAVLVALLYFYRAMQEWLKKG